MQAFIEYVTKRLVNHPDEVRVEVEDRAGVQAYRLTLGPGDAGKIIGRRGTTIQAIRSLVQVGAQKKGIRCTLDLADE
ncbi:MAG: KH domain-containing protein [Verrucomicrobiales bacterium]|nr:KH domain-containing protein [Verrucomicrobiales bacterium]